MSNQSDKEHQDLAAGDKKGSCHVQWCAFKDGSPPTTGQYLVWLVYRDGGEHPWIVTFNKHLNNFEGKPPEICGVKMTHWAHVPKSPGENMDKS